MAQETDFDVPAFVHELMERAGCSELRDCTEVRFMNTGGIWAGSATYERNEPPRALLALNKALWERMQESERKQTLAHEVAHLVVRRREHLAGLPDSQPHGKDWKETMLAFGAEPRTKHLYDTTGIGVNVVPARCFCRPRFGVSKRIASEIRAGKLRFCDNCRYIVELLDK